MSTQTEIEKALDGAFATLGYTFVSYPNGPKQSPTATDMSFEVSTNYAGGEPVGLGSNSANRYLGFYQVNIRCPTTTATGDAPGLSAGRTAAEAISALFTRGSVHQYPALPSAASTFVHMKTPTVVHLGNTDPTWYTIVVRCGFWADV